MAENLKRGNILETKKIRLLKAWESEGTHYSKNTVLEVDLDTAKELVDGGYAEDYKAKAVKQVDQDHDQVIDADGLSTIIRDEIAKAFKESKVEKKPTVIVGDNQQSKDPKGGFKHFGDYLSHVKTSCERGLTQKMTAYQKFTTGHLEETSDSFGGFLVPEEFSNQILEIMHEEGQVAARCQPVPMSTSLVKIPAINETSRADGSRYGGVSTVTTAEGGQATLSNPTFRMIELKPNKKMSLTYTSDELESDSAFPVASILTRLMAKDIAFVVDKEIISGTGSGQALGVLNAAATVSQAAESGQSAATILYQNVVKMWSRMHARSRKNGVWFINQDVEPQLFSMTIPVGTGGAPAYMPAGGLSESPYGTLFGRPVIPIEQCATLGTVGDIVFADMTQYLLAMHGAGVKTAVSPHLRFDYEQNVYRASIRFDGQPWWTAPLTPFAGTATQSPFVTLATRS